MRLSNGNEYELKLELLMSEFGHQCKLWRHANYDDDRRLFCNTYDTLFEALTCMSEITNPFIKVAFNRLYSDEVQMMRSILARF